MEELDGARLIHKIMTRQNGDIALKIAQSVIFEYLFVINRILTLRIKLNFDLVK